WGGIRTHEERNPCRFSRPVPSTTRPPIRTRYFNELDDSRCRTSANIATRLPPDALSCRFATRQRCVDHRVDGIVGLVFPPLEQVGVHGPGSGTRATALGDYAFRLHNDLKKAGAFSS